MKIRIRFAKTGAMRYVGHLDTMHYFQKAFRRTGLKLSFSQGFSPHMLLTFASPLSIGMTTEGDYLDIVLCGEQDPKEVLTLLNAQLCEGFKALDAVRLREEAKTPMALLRAAEYLVTAPSKDSAAADQVFNEAQALMNEEHVPVLKKTKKGERKEDIRPLIYELNQTEGPDGIPALHIICASGSIEHLKPELILQVLAERAGILKEPLWHFHRQELFGVDPRILKPGDPLKDHKLESFMKLDN